MNNPHLEHHGILGQKWGVRNGPPYPLSGGSYSISEKRKIYKKRQTPNSIYNKKHFDEVLKSDKTTLTTLSYDKERTKNSDMFYAATSTLDKHMYNALFNKKISISNGDDGINKSYKFKINNRFLSDVKVASEDSGAKAFMKLYRTDRDFYNFVIDESRLSKHFVEDKYKFRGYRSARDALNKLRKSDYDPTEEDVKTVYRMFNYVIPSSGENERMAKDILNQRTKFFNELKKDGYGAVLDTNDAIYGAFKAESPIIVFDIGNVVLDSVKDTTLLDKRFSELVTIGRKMLNV